jgi:hypothetical protein
MNAFTYPEVHRGDEIDYAPNPETGEAHWALAQVVRTKNNAIDVRLLSDGSRRQDVRHADDPSLAKIPPRIDSGVFRLTNRQKKINQALAENAEIRSRMEALEQTFQAAAAAQAAVAPAQEPAKTEHVQPRKGANQRIKEALEPATL